MVEIAMNRIDTDLLSIEKYMTLSNEDKRNIQSIKIIAPTLEGKDFGKVAVRYKIPRYQMSNTQL